MHLNWSTLFNRARVMQQFDIIKCHGSGNDFILVDVAHNASLAALDWSAFARWACNRTTGIGSDGVLLVVRNEAGIYGMDMLNPDGTHAEMCGNGIRCVARYAYECGYIAERGVITSGGREYRVARAGAIAEAIPTFSVEIPIRLWSHDFPFFAPEASLVGERVEALDDELQFTALNLGNPHLVAAVESISLERLTTLGEKVLTLKELLPNGVNVSLYECRTPRSIFVATYERGAGITLSCGTAMTASATAAALLGRVVRGERIEVRNRGGMVYCTTLPEGDLVTRLEGNATFEWRGSVTYGDEGYGYARTQDYGEAEAWQRFVDELNR